MKKLSIVFAVTLLVGPQLSFAAPAAEFFSKGVELYRSGRFSDATDAFEQAVRRKQRAREAQDYIERIRKETVERIRNRALTGISKANWQSKFYFIHAVDNRVRVGISTQEMFERDSVNFRPGAVEAMLQLSQTLEKADAAKVQIELISETNQGTPQAPEVTAQQLATVFSYLSLATRAQLPKY